MDWSEGVPLMAGNKSLGIYQPSPETTGFWQAVERDELVLKFCEGCEKFLHPRRILCPDCAKSGLEWKRACGRGAVYSFSDVHHNTGVFKNATPYTVGIIELEEGVYLFSRIIPADGRPVGINDRVSVAFRVVEEGDKLPVFVVGDAAP